MRRRKGFTLTELLTGMIIQAMFVITLCGAFYMLVSFGNRTQAILTARERGERVIAFVENRVRNAGLGLHELDSSEKIRNSLSPLSDTNKPLYNLKLPVAITSTDAANPNKDDLKDAVTKYKDDDHNTIHGNILTTLYAQRANDKNLVIIHSGESNTTTNGDETTTTYQPLYTLLNNKEEFNVKNTGFIFDNTGNLQNWAVTPAYGKPVHLQTTTDKKQAGITPQEINATSYVDKEQLIHDGDELLYLKCDRMFVKNDSDNEPNFSFQTLSNVWSDRYPHEKGILSIYFTLDTVNNILDLWVLSTGGKDSKRHSRPSDWPTDAKPTIAQWNANYQYEITYVSHASWKLHNVHFSGSNWN